MSIHDLVKNRQSVRKYKKDSVPFDTVIKIIETARMAPSWANRQCWKFIIVDSRVAKNIIGKASGQENIAKACEDAPYVVVLCADSSESGVKNGMEYYMFDCGLIMENLILVAREEGLSTCVVGWFDEKAVKGVLNIPEDIKVIAFTPLGYGDDKLKPRSRKKEDEVVFHNWWRKDIKAVDN